MFLPFIGAEAPIEQKTLTLIQKPAIVQEKPKELTLAEKIATNYYKCNTDIQWIRADNAECLYKSITSSAAYNPTPAQKPVKTPQNASYNDYEPGQCTWYVANRRFVPAGWGDASSWAYAAKANGWVVTPVPQAGAIAWRSGHVAYVESVGNGVVTISEMNYDWVPYHQRTITVPVSQYSYIY